MTINKTEHKLISDFVMCNNENGSMERKSCLNRQCFEIALKDSPIVVALCDLDLRYMDI